MRHSKFFRYTIGIPIYIIYRHYEYKYGIHPGMMYIGKGLNIVHGDGVYLNARKIGNNFTVYQNVTLGLGKDGIPLIGNNVTVYTGAVVTGNIILEDNCIIGANAYVNCNVPSGSFYAGIPAKMIKEKI